MSDVSGWQRALTSSWGQVWVSFLNILPVIFGAIIIFSIGLLLAFWVKRFVIEILSLLKLDKLSKTAGVDQYLKKADIRHNTIELIGTIAEWLIILVFFLAVVDILGLTAVSQVLTKLLGYIPNVFAAALIFAAGYIIARVAGGLVRGALTSVDREIAKPIGNLARWVILAVSFFAAIDQLQIAQGLIATFFQGLTYTVVLVVGLSVGLGSKDLIAKILNDWYEKISK